MAVYIKGKHPGDSDMGIRAIDRGGLTRGALGLIVGRIRGWGGQAIPLFRDH